LPVIAGDRPEPNRHRPRRALVSDAKPFMKLLHILFSLSILLLCLCQPIFGRPVSDRVDNRNFAIDTYYPTPNEIRLAEQRAQRYWQVHAQRFPNTTRYLAVYATSVLQTEIIQNLYAKVISSETTASFFSRGENDERTNLSCIMIYDTVTNKFVSNIGYVSVDLPPRGSLARWDGYLARYIGW
jgi:hypothetical protein